jgi:hypothetical protein
MTRNPDPKDALASIQTARDDLGHRMSHPLGYDLICAVFWALLVGGAGLETPWSYYVLFVGFAGLGACVRWWKKRHGLSVSNTTRGTRGVATIMVIALVLLMTVSLWSKSTDMAWIPLTTGGLAYLVAVICGRLWLRAFRRDLKASV